MNVKDRSFDKRWRASFQLEKQTEEKKKYCSHHKPPPNRWPIQPARGGCVNENNPLEIAASPAPMGKSFRTVKSCHALFAKDWLCVTVCCP
jgi:hypothetical protein